jgi:hypothetical protein
MKRKPSRTFLYLAFVKGLLLVVGLVLAGVLISNQNNYFVGDYFTGTAVSGTNAAISTGAAATQTWIFVRDIATNLRGFEPSTDYLANRETERQTEVFNIEVSLGATEAAKYWASETAFSTSISLTIDQMFTEATILAQTPTP